jgi:predicted nucleotidyltransferase
MIEIMQEQENGGEIKGVESKKKTIHGLEDYRISEVQSIVTSHIEHLRESFHFEDLDFSIQEIIPFGSRVLGLSKKNSDLDIKVRYTGKAREDDLFNALNERKTKLKIENIKIDFYPEKIEICTSYVLKSKTKTKPSLLRNR